MLSTTLLAGLVVSIVWFIVGAILYMNPYTKKCIKKDMHKASVRKWDKQSEMMVQMYLYSVLIPSLIFAFIYSFIRPVLPVNYGLKILYFGFILIGIKIIPRLADMAMMTNYPKKLLKVDLINGSISCFVIAAVLGLF